MTTDATLHQTIRVKREWTDGLPDAGNPEVITAPYPQRPEAVIEYGIKVPATGQEQHRPDVIGSSLHVTEHPDVTAYWQDEGGEG